jgi:outer membrane protein
MRSYALSAALTGVILLSLPIEASASEQALAPVAGTWFTQNGPIWIRFREASTVRVDGARAAGVKAIPQDDATMSNSIGYNFTSNISAQLVLGALTSTHVENQNGVKLGKTSFGAPSVVIDYRFTELGAIQPFVGVGAMYLFFYDEKGAALSNLKVRDSLGAILRTGAEVMFNQNVGVYVAANKVFIESSAQARLGASRVDAKIEFDPWILQTGVTYRF